MCHVYLLKFSSVSHTPLRALVWGPSESNLLSETDFVVRDTKQRRKMTRRRSKYLIWLHCPSRRNSLLLCGQDWHRRLPPSVLVFLAKAVYSIASFFSQQAQSLTCFKSIWQSLPHHPFGCLCALWLLVGWCISAGGHLQTHYCKEQGATWFPEVKLPANLCVCVATYFSLPFLWCPSCPKLHHRHPDINSSYSCSRQPCCSYLRAGAVEFLIVLPQIWVLDSSPWSPKNQGLSLKIILSNRKNTVAAASAGDKFHSLFNLFK